MVVVLKRKSIMLEKTQKVIKKQICESMTIDPIPVPGKNIVEFGKAVLEDTKDVLKNSEE